MIAVLPTYDILTLWGEFRDIEYAPERSLEIYVKIIIRIG